MKYSVRIRRNAVFHIEDAAEWFQENHPGLEIKFLNDPDQSIKNLQKNPEKFQVRYKMSASNFYPNLVLGFITSSKKM